MNWFEYNIVTFFVQLNFSKWLTAFGVILLYTQMYSILCCYDALWNAMLILSIVTFKVMIIIIVDKEEERCICMRERILNGILIWIFSVEFYLDIVFVSYRLDAITALKLNMCACVMSLSDNSFLDLFMLLSGWNFYFSGTISN